MQYGFVEVGVEQSEAAAGWLGDEETKRGDGM